MQVIYFWVGYAVLMGAAVLGVVAATRKLGGRWQRGVLVALVVAVFAAPSYVVRGYGIGPAWMAAVDARSPHEFLMYAVLPFVVTAGVIFGLFKVVTMLSGKAKVK
jgi:hypothetical protein